jgi:hypothetical protein
MESTVPTAVPFYASNQMASQSDKIIKQFSKEVSESENAI